MEELLKDLIPKLGAPSIVVSIILLIIRMKPITLLTANPLERKMLSKEKQFSIKVLKILAEVLFILIYMLLITDRFFTNKNIYNNYFAFVFGLLVFTYRLLACCIFYLM
ncbi:hypothetical protein HMSSN036_87180 [Paenibacillus macerans]|nr:hypothetical protein HMSSN036_87180 [Paenibacillus macerans]